MNVAVKYKARVIGAGFALFLLQILQMLVVVGWKCLVKVLRLYFGKLF